VDTLPLSRPFFTPKTAFWASLSLKDVDSPH
jgi:hypothetical protein